LLTSRGIKDIGNWRFEIGGREEEVPSEKCEEGEIAD
jgi:hypothetical protein